MMSHALPSKRRKMRHSLSTSNPKKGAHASPSYDMSAAPADQSPHVVQMVWPPRRLPVELFTLIIAYLPRSNIQNMRLVNKEFEEKVSEYLFKVVVVPFKPEIYGINPEPALSGAPVLQGAVMLQDKGMRVFQGYVSYTTSAILCCY